MTRLDMSRVRDTQQTAPDPYDPLLYPRLGTRELAVIAEFARCREYSPGELVYDQGTRNAPLIVIETGAVDVLDRRPDGDVRFSHVEAGNFLGDIAMFTGHPTIAACVATEPTRALEIPREDLQRLVTQHGDIGELLLKTFLARRTWLEGHGYGQATVIGSTRSQEAFRLREFLTRNEVPFRWQDLETDADGQATLQQWGISTAETPVLICRSGVARNPGLDVIASKLGLHVDPDGDVYDLVIAGAGPAGLAAAVYGASEGLRTFVLDARWPGGQAGTSSKIENYLGFVTGISGDELTRQAVLQARKFGATISNPSRAIGLEDAGDIKIIHLDDGHQVRTRTVLIASGADYRKLECPSCGRYEGRGVYYAASHLEVSGCIGKDVAIVGAGNSAGQATMFLSACARHVYLLVRGNGLADARMSQYLIERIQSAPNIELLPYTQVTHLDGDGQLEIVDVTARDGSTRALNVAALFVMIGAIPRTEWLDSAVLLDSKGFVLTGDDLRHDPRFATRWPLERDPYLLETSIPGVFAAGDVRHDSVKRVASAVGEGAMSVTLAHRWLTQQLQGVH